jgi:IclR family transcriptional regulator, mhp operon transcriptional activator
LRIEGKNDMTSFRPVTALQRGLDVLEVINRGKSVSLQGIHQETKLHKATVIRMLETLIDSGYVTKTARSTYASTGRTLLLSQGYDIVTRIGEATTPTLTQFRKEIGWPSDIGIYSGDDSMIVAQTSREHGPLYFRRDPGYRAPILVTSLGLAYLAFCSAEERRRLVTYLATIGGPKTKLARKPGALEERLAEIRLRGFAIMDPSYSAEEYQGSIWGMAVPIRDKERVYASVNILMLRSAITEAQGVKQFLKPLQRVARVLGELIGPSNPGIPLEESSVER